MRDDYRHNKRKRKIKRKNEENVIDFRFVKTRLLNKWPKKKLKIKIKNGNEFFGTQNFA